MPFRNSFGSFSGQLWMGSLSAALATGLAFAPAVALAQTPYWDTSSGGSSTGAFSTPQQLQPQQPYYGSGNGYSPAPYNSAQNYNNGAIRGYVSSAPVGTQLTVTTGTYLSSDNSHTGDPVTATLGADLAMGGRVLLPAGTQLQGQVASAVLGGRTEKPGQLQLRFNQATLPDGRTIPLSAKVVTKDGSGIIRGGTGKGRVGSYAKNTLGGAALGAASGLALGALVGGHHKLNEGLMWGSILGAGGGAAKATLSRGDEAEIQPGTQLQLMLDQPLSLSAGSSAPSYNGY